MVDETVGVVLAAGAGSRLAPLTRLRPKALCPVGGVPLVDLAISRVKPQVDEVAVNVHNGRDLMESHLRRPGAPAVHLSIEPDVARGTAGALGFAREWIAGRNVLVTNADAWLPADLEVLTDGWDGERCRLLCVRDPRRGDFGDLRYCGACLLPGVLVSPLEPTPSGLYEVLWRAERVAGRLDLVTTDGPFVDCGTASDYLAANMAASAGESVVGERSVIGAGSELVRTVVWDDAVVEPGERLVDAIRAPGVTVLVR